MPLNLLKHKSWNVYSPANVERVRKDEEEARKREEAEDARLNEIDTDKRLAKLRGEEYKEPESKDVVVKIKKRKKGYDDYETLLEEREEMKQKAQPKNVSSSGHVNFWAELEAPGKQEPKELKVDDGWNTRLDRVNDRKAWYDGNDNGIVDENIELKRDKDRRHKDRNDPLADIYKYTKSYKSQGTSKDGARPRIMHDEGKSNKLTGIEALREARLKRERVEAEKAKMLVQGGEQKSERVGYSNQYNPKSARYR